MRRIFVLFLVFVLSSCALFDNEQNTAEVPVPDYKRFAQNVTVVSQTTTGVVYEYKNVRIDELAVLAALYCHEHSGKKARLDKITLYHNHSRRAYFACHNF